MLQAYVREYPHTITIDGIVCFIHNQFFAQAGRIELVIGFYKATNMRRMRRGAPLFWLRNSKAPLFLPLFRIAAMDKWAHL